MTEYCLGTTQKLLKDEKAKNKRLRAINAELGAILFEARVWLDTADRVRALLNRAIDSDDYETQQQIANELAALARARGER